MPITMNDLSVPFAHVDRSTLLEDWRWLIGEHKTPFLITAMGDAFLQDAEDGSAWLLNANEGELHQVADSIEKLQGLLSDRDFVYSEFLVEDFVAAREAGKVLSESQVYGYVHPPVLGGSFDVANLEPTDLQVHFSLLGQIHQQVKDLPEGANISISISGVPSSDA